MNKALMAALAVLLAAGCSSMQVASTQQDTVDREYMSRVDQTAKRYGTQVVWINLPQKRTPATQ
ncbi:MAG: hypothetical protein ACRECQ_08500 [Burkholderiaceae bacterium]